MERFYIVLEIQGDGQTRATLTDVYEDFDEALAKLYTVLAAAAVSQLDFHACYIISNDGNTLDGRAFDRRTA